MSSGEIDDELVNLHEQYYIQATSSRTDDRTRVLKHGETFAVFDRFGDVQPVGLGEQGIYHEGTRFLSRLELRIGGRRPLLLSSTVRKENDLLTVDLANPDLKNQAGHIALPRGTLHIFRTKFLHAGACHERLRVSNFGLTPVETELILDFAADYADIFEVRGSKRARRGRRLDDAVEAGVVTLGYRGLDEITRRTRLVFDPPPDQLSGREARFRLRLAPQQTVTFRIGFACGIGDAAPQPPSEEEALSALQDELSRGLLMPCRIRATNGDLDEWIGRSVSDMQMMISETRDGPFPYAGVPWYSTPFGRDGIITALEVLVVAPEVARGVLAHLGALQATDYEPERDAQPGKILHEARGGEMATLGEVPFGRYYGSVDSTPLYVMLAAATWRRTGDLEFLRGIWGYVQRALAWIDKDGDLDGDGFVEYARMTPNGLLQQGWKDSHDSVFHADSSTAEGPIALCEVQGYVYAAWEGAAEMAGALGDELLAHEYRRRAAALKQLFAERFWSERLGTYVLALDGAKRPCQVRSSNAGHALWTGIADATHVGRLSATLMGDESFSGWGIRTIGSGESRYNPMSYHNGSIWPHDNAVIAAGLARYGFRHLAVNLLEGMLDASRFVDLRRLPELWCGFPRRAGEGPTLYPVACAPQAWAAGTVFMMLAAVLGLSVDGRRGEVTFSHPTLPASIPQLRITGLAAGAGRVDLLLENHPHDVGITVLRREGPARVVVIK